MNIDVTKWPKVTNKAPEAGLYFFIDEDGTHGTVYKPAGESCVSNWTYYGPVTFGPCAPHLDLSSLDLSKIPAKDQPESAGVWAGFNASGVRIYLAVSEELLNNNCGFTGSTWQRIGDFTPPAPVVLPPIEEIKLYLVRDTNGKREWCRKAQVAYWIHGTESRFCPLADGTEEATRTLAAKEVV